MDSCSLCRIWFAYWANVWFFWVYLYGMGPSTSVIRKKKKTKRKKMWEQLVPRRLSLWKPYLWMSRRTRPSYISRHQTILSTKKICSEKKVTMKSLYPTRPIAAVPKFNSTSYTKISAITNVATPTLNFWVSSPHPIRSLNDFPKPHPHTALRSQSPSNPQSNKQEKDEVEEEEDPDAQVQDLVVPEHWLVPSKALEVQFSLNLQKLNFSCFWIDCFDWMISIYLSRNQSG